MPQIYIFLLAVLAITVLVGRRHFIFSREKHEQFKKEVAVKIQESKKIEHVEMKKRFKDELVREQRGQKFDIAKFRDEMRKAEMAMAKKQWSEAKKYLIQATALSNDEVPVTIKLAGVYMDSGDIKKAETIYRRLIEVAPDNPEIYENLGKILVKKKQYKEAIQAYVRAVELDEKDDKKFIALGRLYQLLMRYSIAAECYRRAAELKPREVEYMFLLADACKADEDYDNALFSYEKILTIEPYNERAKTGASDVRLKQKEVESFLQ